MSKIFTYVINYLNVFFLLCFKFLSLRSFYLLVKKLKLTNFRKVKVTSLSNKIVLLDGIWENYNHLFRLLLVFFAIRENYLPVVIIKNKTRIFTKYFFKILGVKNFYIIDNVNTQEFLSRAKKKIKSINNIFNIKLPLQFPFFIFYDYFLKKNKIASYDKNKEKLLIEELAYFIGLFKEIEEILKQKKIKYFITSHLEPYILSIISWVLLKKNKANILHVFQEDINITIRKLKTLNELKAKKKDIVQLHDMQKIKSKVKNNLLKIGKNYIDSLMKGEKQINNFIGAYVKRNNSEIIKKNNFYKTFNFKKNLPIATIYLNCLTDFPNINGKSWYKDYLNWTSIALKTAKKNKKINFIFKPHPAEKMYGIYVKNFFNDLKNDNIRFFNNEISDLDLLLNSNFIITNIGSIAHEALHLDKIVIAEKKNFISPFGFSYSYKNKKEFIFYLKNLQNLKNKIKNKICIKNKFYLYLFYAFRFIRHPNKLIYQNHLASDKNAITINKYLKKNLKNIIKEIETIKKWNSKSGEKNYSVYKLLN